MEIDRQRLRDDDYYYTDVCTTLYETYGRAILWYCVARLGDYFGEDVMHDVFVKVMKTLRTSPPELPIEQWLFGEARHKCLHTLRNRRRRGEIAAAFAKDILQQLHAGTFELPTEEPETRERGTQLATSLTKLRERDQILLYWRYHRGLSAAESAEALGIEKNAVYKRIERALRRLKKLMADDPTR
jgi:RNA polymerase sigma factor (sigma-70 family)